MQLCDMEVEARLPWSLLHLSVTQQMEVRGFCYSDGFQFVVLFVNNCVHEKLVLLASTGASAGRTQKRSRRCFYLCAVCSCILYHYAAFTFAAFIWHKANGFGFNAGRNLQCHADDASSLYFSQNPVCTEVVNLFGVHDRPRNCRRSGVY